MFNIINVNIKWWFSQNYLNFYFKEKKRNKRKKINFQDKDLQKKESYEERKKEFQRRDRHQVKFKMYHKNV